MPDSSALLDFAKNLAREAGERILSDVKERVAVSDTAEKGPLAKGDLAAHEIVLEKINGKFPDHTLISEEGETRQKLGRHTWICDPICGTYNYLRGIPYFAIGLSYLIDEEIQICVIYNPVSRELFHAVKGGGSYLNNQKIRVSPENNLRDAVVDFNVNFSSPLDQEKGKTLFSLLCPPVVARLRLTESANLDLAYVACGRYDAYLHPSDKIWDKTAGKLLIEEAGGIVMDFSKEDRFSLFEQGVIATNEALMKPLKLAISGMFEHQ